MALDSKTTLANLPSSYKKTFWLYINLFKKIGIDIFGPKLGRKNVNALTRLFFFNIMFIPFLTIQQISVICKFDPNNFLEGAANVPITLLFVLNVIKMTITLKKKDEIVWIFLEIGELWPKRLDVNSKRVIMETWLRRMGVLIKSSFIYAVVNVVTFIATPFLATCYNISAGVNEYLFPVLPPDLWRINSTTTFLITYVLEASACIPCQLCLYFPYDLLLVTIASNTSILLRLLQVDLENAIEARSQSNNPEDSYDQIVEIVKVHQRILRIGQILSNSVKKRCALPMWHCFQKAMPHSIVAKMNDFFGLVVFIHIVFASLLICFFGFLTVVLGGVAETITNLITVLNSVLIIFLLAVSGQLLYDTSSGVADAAYNSLWYDSDMRVKRLVLFIIIRSQQPCYLSALGYSNINLCAFSKIMSTAWTYFSLLIQLYQDN